MSNPRTVAERRDNSRILQGFNLGHNDDIFNKGGSRGANWQSTSGKTTKKTAGNGSNKLADGILNELFDSDSGEGKLNNCSRISMKDEDIFALHDFI